MAEHAHDSTIGVWHYQKRPLAADLDRMTRNGRAAHWNKPRATRYRASTNIGGQLYGDAEDTHQCLLCGVRVIRGTTSPFPSTAIALAPYQAADLHDNSYIGEPQVIFPQGKGLPPFIRRPVVICNFLGFEIEKVTPDDDEYSFVDYFGGLDWGATGNTTTPEGIEYKINPLFTRTLWPRAVVARPIGVTHTGQTAYDDLLIGLRFRVIFGRLGGQVFGPADGGLGGSRPPGAYYIHYQAMGPVGAY